MAKSTSWSAWWGRQMFELGIGSVVIGRRRAPGVVQCGVFLIDAWCLGVKDAFFSELPEEEFPEEIFERAPESEDFEEIDPGRARRLVEEAVAYAKSFGFSPHRDYRKARRVFGGLSADTAGEPFVFGRKGMPCYVQSADESPERVRIILGILKNRCGHDGFRYMVDDEDLESDDDYFDDDFEEEDDEEDEAPLPPFDPRAMEELMARIHRHMSGKEFETAEEAQAYISDLLAKGDVPAMPEGELTPLEEAQNLVYRAAKESSGKRRVDLARQAIEICEDCADGWILIAEEEAGTLQEARLYYEKALEAGRRALGEEFDQDRGHFWGILETRPFMRAKEGLAIVLWKLGERDEAVRHELEMLELNPNDNQGVRDLVVPHLLQLGRDDEAGRILENYKQDGLAAHKYSVALHRFRVQGPGRAADRALREALEANRDAARLLSGRLKPRRRPPASYTIGSREEAEICWGNLHEAWKSTPGAIEWLRKKIDSEP